MSEFLAEAQVLITPDTTKFRTLLQAELAAATRTPFTIPVVPAVVDPRQLQTLTTATGTAAAQQQLLGLETERTSKRLTDQERALRASNAQFAKARQGLLATTATMSGLRGAAIGASGPFLAAAVSVTAFAKAVQAAAGLETELNVFRVTARATADEMERVAAESRALGRDIRLPGVSSRDAAEAMTNLARAGLEVEDALAGARGVLQLAAAAQISNAEATELAAGALNAFQLAGDEAAHVADVLANSANEAQGSISDMGLALRQSAAISDLVGLSLEDTAGFLTILARAGVRGSDAGTSFRVALQRLIAPTKTAAAAIDDLNLRLRDSEGRLRPEVFFELGEALRDMSVAQRQATLVTIFGADASRAAALIGRESIQTFREVQEALDRQGAAAELAGARAQGLAGQMSALSSNLETLGTSLGTVVLPPLEFFVGALNEAVTTASATVEALQELRGAVSLFGGVIEDSGVPGLNRYVDGLKEVVKFSIGGPLLGQARLIKKVSDQFSSSGDQIQGDARETTAEVEKLFQSFRQTGGGPTALNELVLALDEMADRLAKGDADAIKLGRSIREIIKAVQAGGGAPFKDFVLPPIDPAAFLSDVETTGRRGGDILLGALKDTLGPAAAQALGFDFMSNIGHGAADAAPSAAAEAGTVFVQSLGTQLEVAEATGASDSEILRILREREAKQAAFLERLLDRPQDAKTQALVREAANNLEQTRNEIQGILDQQASDAKAAAADIAQAQSDADQAVLDSISGREGRLQNAAIAAAATENLRDDIRTNVALRNFYRSAIKEAKKTIVDAKLRAQTVVALTRDLIRADAEVKAAKEAQRQAARDAAQDRIDERREALELNRQFAQTTGNEAAEVRAINAQLLFINKLIADAKKGTNEWRKLRNERARLRKEREELLGEEKEGNTLAQTQFEFLQKQQGFAANLLGNLIPSDATAGLVGGTTPPPPDRPLNALAAVKASRDQGVTPGQFGQLLGIQGRMLDVLERIAAGNRAPEAKFQKASSGASMDFQGGV